MEEYGAFEYISGIRGKSIDGKKSQPATVWVNPICLFNPPFIMVPPFCGHFAHPESIIRPNAFPTSFDESEKQKEESGHAQINFGAFVAMPPFSSGGDENRKE
jgi:hypothetical protein